MTAYAFEGVTNFRDFGGHVTSDGKRVATGRLFRSAHYSGVTPDDVAALDRLGVKLLLDLRLKPEREQYPNRWTPARVLFRDPDHPVARPADPTALERTAEYSRNAMREAYARHPYDPRFIYMFRELFDVLAQEGGPVIIHCAAGKDRTGIACALVLDALGVERETIFEDYLRTNDSLDRVARAKLVRARLGAHLTDEAVAPLIGVERSYLQSAIDVMEARSGSLSGYVRSELGVSDEMRGQMHAHLVR